MRQKAAIDTPKNTFHHSQPHIYIHVYTRIYTLYLLCMLVCMYVCMSVVICINKYTHPNTNLDLVIIRTHKTDKLRGINLTGTKCWLVAAGGDRAAGSSVSYHKLCQVSMYAAPINAHTHTYTYTQAQCSHFTK